MAQFGTSGVVAVAAQRGTQRVRGVAAGLGGPSTDDVELWSSPARGCCSPTAPAKSG